MVNTFFKNNGPYKLSEILYELNIKIKEINNEVAYIWINRPDKRMPWILMYGLVSQI